MYQNCKEVYGLIKQAQRGNVFPPPVPRTTRRLRMYPQTISKEQANITRTLSVKESASRASDPQIKLFVINIAYMYILDVLLVKWFRFCKNSPPYYFTHTHTKTHSNNFACKITIYILTGICTCVQSTV